MSSTPTIHIEIKLFRNQLHLHDEIKRAVAEWLRSNFTHLQVGERIDLTKGHLQCATSIISLQVTKHSETSTANIVHSLMSHELRLYLYTLHTLEYEEEDASVPTSFTLRSLPHEEFDGLWEGLVFGDPIGEDVLRTTIRSLLFRKDPRMPRRHCVSNILFHGPPGTGKTTLALALAQKLSIQLSESYAPIQLLRIHSHTLLSRFFGESPKEIGKLFECIYDRASDEPNLIVVLFDEVESLASSRAAALAKNEVDDAIRSTNELLRGLDRFNELPNVLFIATSNLVENMDPAFLDRFQYKQFIGKPDASAAYELLRSKVNELVERGIVASPSDQTNFLIPSDNGSLMAHVGLNTMHGNPDATQAALELHNIAARVSSLSARQLNNLITVAICKHTEGRSFTMHKILSALVKAVDGIVGTKETSDDSGGRRTEPDVIDVKENDQRPEDSDMEALSDEAEYIGMMKDVPNWREAVGSRLQCSLTAEPKTI